MNFIKFSNRKDKILFGTLVGFIGIAISGGIVLGMINNTSLKNPSNSILTLSGSGQSDTLSDLNSQVILISQEQSGIIVSQQSSNDYSLIVKSSGIVSSTGISKASSHNSTATSESASSSSILELTGNDLVQDPGFLRGFRVKGLSTITDGNKDFGFFDYDGDFSVRSTNPLWDLAAWYSGYSIGDNHTYTKISDGNYLYEDFNKKVRINTNESSISLRLDASKYYTAPRKNGENWPHLLIGQGGKDYSDTDYFYKRKIDQMKELRVTFDAKLVYFNDAMGSTANPGLHGCGFYNYLYIQDLNKNSPGYGQMIWFGFPLFDNRTAWCAEFAAADGGKADASGMFIYQIPQNKFMPDTFWKDGKPSASEANPWIHVDFDCMPYIQRALTLAHERNYMKDTNFDELYLNGLNIGWEMYGTYDGEISIKNYHIMAIPK